MEASAAGASDVVILRRLSEICNPECSERKTPDSSTGKLRPGQGGREQSRLRDVQAELAIVEAFFAERGGGKYLDLGCAEGNITAAFAGALKLPPDRAHACDVEEQPPVPTFTFTQVSQESLPYPNEEFSFVTMFMAAHHFVDTARTFAEARRVLVPGGLLLIREHNCASPARALFYDAVHALYACALQEPGTDPEETPEVFVRHYDTAPDKPPFATYRSAEEWTAALKAAGFVPHRNAPKAHGPISSGRGRGRGRERGRGRGRGRGSRGYGRDRKRHYYGHDRFDSFYALFVAVAAPQLEPKEKSLESFSFVRQNTRARRLLPQEKR